MIVSLLFQLSLIIEDNMRGELNIKFNVHLMAGLQAMFLALHPEGQE